MTDIAAARNEIDAIDTAILDLLRKRNSAVIKIAAGKYRDGAPVKNQERESAHLLELLKIAEEKQLDLVKIAPQAKPPVCKIMDYGKYRFELQKKEKENRKNQHHVDIKEVQLSLNIDTHDLETKVNNARRFLGHGDKVKVSIRFRGREMAHPERGYEIMERFAGYLTDVGTIEKPAKMESRNMLMFMAPVKQAK